MRQRAVVRACRQQRRGAPIAAWRRAAALLAATSMMACGGSGRTPEAGGGTTPPPATQPPDAEEPGPTDGTEAAPDVLDGPDRGSDARDTDQLGPDEGDGRVTEQQDGREDEDGGEEGPRRTRVVAWILGLGPSAPAGPSAFRAYALLERLDCQGLLDRLDSDDHPEALTLGTASEELYRATALACLAGLHGRPELWAEAEALAGGAGAGTGSCLDLATRTVLDGLLAVGRADPDARVEPGSGSDASSPPCPRLAGISPTSGPPGTVVRLQVRNLDHVVAVELRRRDASGPGDRGSPVAELDGADALEAARVGADTVLLQVPTAVEPGELCVVVRAVPDWDADAAAFTLTAATDGEEEGAETSSGGTGDAAEGDAGAPGAAASAPPSACPPQP